MERAEFRKAVFERDHHRCVFCGEPAVDAHHIMERRLWDDGGYHLDNGASVCAEHHMLCEETWLSPEEVREAAGITKVLLPPHLYSDLVYDKWGNIMEPGGVRIPGELFWDESVQKVLSRGPIPPERFLRRFKYPRTFHLPWSPGAIDDDRVMKEIPWSNDTEVVVTEKMDGENTTMYKDYIHARSLTDSYHVSRNWVKNLHGRIAHEIPDGWRLCGENLQAKHSIEYNGLPSYFMLFSVWNEVNECLHWDSTVEWAELFGIPTVPVLWRGEWGWWSEEDMPEGWCEYSKKAEGYVIRVADQFDYSDFRKSVGKYVRAGHVDEGRHHWAREQMVENSLG